MTRPRIFAESAVLPSTYFFGLQVAKLTVMAALLTRWFGAPNKGNNIGVAQKKGLQTYPHLTTTDLPSTPFSEIRILSGHTGNIHQIARIDEDKIVSASTDGTAIVWNAQTGERLHVLRCIEGSVVCVLPLLAIADSSEACLIITASAEGTMRLWDLNIEDPYQDDGCCQKVITEHNGTVKCLAQLSHEMICSGGQDLCLWDRNGRLLSKCDRQSLEESSSIHSVLKLDSRHFGVVAASDYKSLAVYDINKSTMREKDHYELVFVRYLYNTHNDDICCLASVSTNFFASGSRDGVILLWSTNSLSAMKMFNSADTISQPVLKDISGPSFVQAADTNIRQILAIGERYLFAAIGSGFRLYDVLAHEDGRGHPKPLASHSHAHQKPITCLEFLEDRSILLTASEDNAIRVWGHPNRLKRDNDSISVNTDSLAIQGRMCIEEFLGVELNPSRARRKSGTTMTIVPTLLGEMLLHSNQVKIIKKLGEHGIVTGGADQMIIIWKDGDKEREKRDEQIRSLLKGDLKNIS